MASRFNVAKATNNGGGGIDNPALDVGYISTGLNNLHTNNVQDSQDLDQSFCHLTMEALPRADYYKNNKDAIKRPSLGELHGEPRTIDMHQEERSAFAAEDAEHMGVKLGWIQGVLIPCLLNIWGVMLFLRLSWVVAESGILQTLLIIAVSSVVCVLTTLSLSAICTNGEVKGGGIYYIISRSLGPEFGASVGVIFAFANAVSASMNTIGFCDSFNSLLASYGLKIVDGGLTDVRIVGVISVFIMIIICAIGMEWESKAQNFLVVIILAAILDFLVGTVIGPLNDTAKAQGFSGFSLDVLQQNWPADYQPSAGQAQNVFTVFSIFFPSVTGIQAGANISGDLKNPAEAIPKGTLLALLISMCSYAIFVIFAGGAALRGASGNLTDYYDGTYTNCTADNPCPFGLQYNYNMMQLMSSWGLLIYAGCFAATLSTALTNLLSVPRLVQALGIDRIYPGLIFFSKGYGKSGEPYRGYVLTFLISASFVLIAEINVLAPLISNFYLASYALINFCTFHAALVRPLGWRPTFRFYNKWLSLFAFFLCIAIMFLISFQTSIVTFIVFFILYLVVIYRNPNVNWGSSTQAQTYKRSLMLMHKLFNQSEHVKNYQPQILLLAGQPQSRPPLVDLANLITRNNSLLVCAEISKNRLTYRQRVALMKQGQTWLGIRKVKGFFTVADGYKYEVAARGLIQCSGVGRLKPNVLMMGYKSNWLTCNVEDLQAYFNILHDAFENRLSVTILRLAEGLDLTKSTDLAHYPEELSVSMGDLSNGSNSAGNGMVHNDSNLSYILPNVLSQTSLTIPGSKATERPTNPWENSPSGVLKQKKKKIASQILHQYEGGQEISKAVLDSMMTFSKKQKGGVIDVWWLYDDGGLTILLPYILSTRSSWSDCQMRIFALANRTTELQSEEQGMANLLAKFRIKYTSLTMIHNISEAPKQETINFFENLISGFRESNRDAECVVTNEEYESLKEKTYRQLRLRELLQKHSKHSTLVVMSLPMPRKGLVSAPLYMAWLEAITKDMPPFLLVRGNQTSVLTFYS